MNLDALDDPHPPLPPEWDDPWRSAIITVCAWLAILLACLICWAALLTTIL